MPVVIADQFLLDALDDATADGDELGGVLRLYKNNYTPLVGSVAGDFTPANFSGYGHYDLLAGGQEFPAATPDGSNDAESVHADINFVHNGGGTANDIYGWYLLDQSGNLIAAERYASAPFTMAVNGATFTVTPTVKLKR